MDGHALTGDILLPDPRRTRTKALTSMSRSRLPWLPPLPLPLSLSSTTGLERDRLAGHHQPLRVWVLCLYFMGLNLSNRQIAGELGLDASDTQAMTEQLRRGLVAKTPAVELKGEVEIDEVYVVAGHKGQPAAVAKRDGSGGVASWQARRDAARWKRTSRPSSA